MKLTKDQVKTIIKNAPAGADKTKLLDGLISRGYELEGVDTQQALAQIRKKQELQQVQNPNDISSASAIGNDMKNTVTGAFRGGVDKTKEGFKQAQNAQNPIDLLEGGLKTAAGVIGTAFSPLAPITKPIGDAVNYVGDKIGDNKAVQDFAMSKAGENTYRVASDIADVSTIAGTVAGIKSAPGTVNKINTAVTKNVATKTGTGGTGTGGGVRLSIAKKNVNPHLESSVSRLFSDGTKKSETPVATYDKYLTQSKKAIGDIKQDPAISVVGEKMGNAFETVVKQRSKVGKVLGEELKANSKVKINITEPKASLLSELKDSGLSYNPKTNQLTSFQGSKFATGEVSMLDDFVRGVNQLGDNPTVSQIDNFISKTRSDLAFTKGKSGVMGTTNAERIINGGIAKLRATLDPAVNGNKALSNYWKANKTYSELSDFIDEGSTFLGKKTLSGDFAKDASVAKSSVQSILNQGKKDFMIKLEKLTGYKAIDDAVLALQAMKDAGDFRGLSLLQAMSETGIPMSKTGITQKILDYALQKGGEFIAGTPEQQTRALLQSLEKSLVKPTIAKPTSSTKPTTGAKINKSVQPNSSKDVISPKSTTKSLKVKGETPKQLQKDLTLKGDDARIQDASIAKYESNPSKLTQDYIKTNGKVVNTDEARKLFKDVGYKGSNSPAVQEASSAVAKDAWKALLKTSKENDSLIYAGGSGTGKTSAVKNILADEIKDAGAILDGNLSTMKSAQARINESIDAGKYPTIVYVYRDPVDAWINGVIKRMKTNKEEGGRIVPLSVFLENHKGSYNVVKSLMNDNGMGTKFDVKLVDNSLGRGNQTLLNQSKFDKIKYQENLGAELKTLTKKLYDNKTITKEQYEALIK